MAPRPTIPPPAPTLAASAPPSIALTPPLPSSVGSASAFAAPSASGAQALAGDGTVRIHDRKVFVVKVPRGGQTAVQRAREATRVLEHAVDESDEPDVRVVVEKDDAVVLFAGASPVIQFGPADAEADGDASVKVHAEGAAAKTTEALGAERKRSAIATTVFSISLLVLSGLLAFLVLRKLGDLVTRARNWIVEHPERLPELRVANVELLHRAALRGVILVGLDVAKWIVRVGVAYLWVLFALSSFEPTRPYGEKLGGVVLAPVSELMGRAVSAFPVMIIGALAVFTVVLLVRFVGLFFRSVERRETTLGWLPYDLVAPTSMLVRGGIIVVALVVAAPLVTGADDGALSRAGMVALAAIGISSTPLLASVAVGVFLVYGRRLKVGEHAEVGGRIGTIFALSLLETTLRDREGCEIRVPHLTCLLHPTRVLGAAPPVRFEVTVSPLASQTKTREVLAKAASQHSVGSEVELLGLDVDGARYAVTVFSADKSAATRLGCALADALSEAGIALGKGPRS